MRFGQKFIDWTKDAYYLIFRNPAETQLRIQELEHHKSGGSEERLPFNSYVAIKRAHQKIKRSFFGLFTGACVAFILTFVGVLLVINFIYWSFGWSDNNPFAWGNLLKLVKSFRL